MNRIQMEAIINSGGHVLWLGNILSTIGELPTQDEIDLVYAESRGPSAYEVAVNNGFVGTEAEWLASLVGPEGDLGPEGESAYQVAVDNGFVGDEAAWLASLVGPQGPQGDPGLDGTGSGNMNGPASSVDGNIPLFDGTTGELLKDSGVGLSSKQDALGFTPVPNTRTVNGHALSADVSVTKSDVGLGSVTNDAQLKAADLDTDSTFAANSDSKIPSQKAVKTAIAAEATARDAKVDDTAYNATSWDGVTTVAPSKNAVRDKIEALAATIPTVSDTAYDATSWDGVTTVAPSKNAVRDKIEAMPAAIVSDTAYDATSWDGVTTVAPSKNAVRDKIEAMPAAIVDDTAYDATTWNGDTTHAPSKNAVRDKIESLSSGGPSLIVIGYGNLGSAGTTYCDPAGGNSTENVATFICPVAGTLSKLYVYRISGAGSTGTSTFTLRINGSDTAVTCQSANNGSANTVISDLTNSVSVAAGDKVSLKFVSGSSAGGIAKGSIKIS